MNLNKMQDAIIAEFDLVVDSIGSRLKYFRHLAGLGSRPGSQIETVRSGDKLIKDTRSKIWLDAQYKNGKVYYTADSDNRIMRGILSLYLRVFSGKTPLEIINSNIYFLSEIKLYKFLPPLRLKELSAVLQGIRRHALSFKLQTLQAS
ncbi:MAG TPA: SufE family protein [Chitinophagaceae bacterium]|nr:SufE family protein [Chitinophagaceae bacterium]